MPKFLDEKTRTKNLIERTISDLMEVKEIFLEKADSWQDLKQVQVDFMNCLEEKQEIMRRNLSELQKTKDIPQDS